MTVEGTRLWTALVTPMHENGEIHEEDLAALIHRQSDAGNGVLLLGSTGEGLALGLEDKQKVIKIASSLNIDVPIMAGVGGFNLKEQFEWIEFCQEYEIDSFLLVTPLYAKPGQKGQVAWFKALLDAADAPCMLYNVPSRTGSDLHPLVLDELGDHPNFFAVKEASGSIDDYQKYRKRSHGQSFYSGDDGLTPFFAMAGCDGLVSVAANVWPEATRRYVDWCLAGRGPELLPLWQECTDALFKAPNPVPAKVLLKEKGEISSAALRPPLTDEEIEDTGFLTSADKRIEAWYRDTEDK